MQNKFYNLGFAFDSIGRSQSALLCVANANKLLSQDYKISISAFYEQNDMPCVNMNFCRYYTSCAQSFPGDLFSCSFNVMQAVSMYSLPKHYYYIQDIEYERPWIQKTAKLSAFNSIMQDEGIVKIFRSEDHYKKFYSDGYKVDKLLVKDFDIQQLLEIIDDNR